MALTYWRRTICGLLVSLITGIGGELFTRNSSRQFDTGSSHIITCNASLLKNETLYFSFDDEVVYYIQAHDFSEPMEVNLLRNRSQISAVIGRILTTNPPEVIVTMHYNISSATRMDGGLYVCRYMEHKATHNLTVYSPPYGLEIRASDVIGINPEKLKSFDADMYPLSAAVWEAKVNIDYTTPYILTANALAIPGANVTWYLGDTLTASTSTLRLDRAAEALADNSYICTARNRLGSYQSSVKIVKHYKPRPPIIAGEYSETLEGTLLSIRCVFDASPAAVVIYFKSDPAMDNSTQLDAADGQLHFSSADLKRHVGSYKCRGKNIHGFAEKSFPVKSEEWVDAIGPAVVWPKVLTTNPNTTTAEIPAGLLDNSANQYAANHSIACVLMCWVVSLASYL